jgi:hypothetical protein
MEAAPATPSDFWRLADEARRRGVMILTEPSTSERFATSATEPRVIHRVNPSVCSCKGFAAWRRCTHQALLIAELGWLPDDPDRDPDPSPAPAPSAACAAPSGEIPCPLCDGATAPSCPICDGRGVVAVWSPPTSEAGDGVSGHSLRVPDGAGGRVWPARDAAGTSDGDVRRGLAAWRGRRGRSAA